MKKIILALLLTPFLIACEREQDTPTESKGTMSAVIDGKAWTAGLSVQAQKTTTNPIILTLAGTGNGSQVNINIKNYKGPGTYTTKSGMIAIYTNTTTLQTFAADTVLGTGTIDVSEVSGEVSGTFSCKAINPNNMGSVDVKDGKFKIKL